MWYSDVSPPYTFGPNRKYPLQDGFDGLNQQIKDENRKMSSIEGDISDIMVSNESINMKINNYEAENIELKAKCDELKRTGK